MYRIIYTLTNSGYNSFVERELSRMKVEFINPCVEWESILSKHGYEIRFNNAFTGFD